MIEKDVIIVGGGPAGSSCALHLKQSNLDILILDKENFPRVKLCAGWITPKVYSLLKMDPYPYGILKFDKIFVSYYTKKNREIKFSINTTQYSIRRYEFDYWLLQKSGVEFKKHLVKNIQKEQGYYIIDGIFKTKFLVGAGGTYCPVYKTFFRDINPKSKEYQIAALEIEFPYEYQDKNCYLWFCENDLPGYAWYVPKANGFLNIGIGAFSHHLKEKNLHWHFDYFTNKLKKLNLLKNLEREPKGHTYYLRENVRNYTNHQSCIVGDSLGLATLDLGEGIGPAIESGIAAANWILNKKPINLNTISKYSILEFGWKGKIIYNILKFLHLFKMA
ncbi:MAG: FAD-dependent oxidoreductase [Leptonema sp. (in: bacteria)]